MTATGGDGAGNGAGAGIAALPMYDLPGTQAVNDRLWTAVRAALGHGPAHLTRGADPWDVWRAPDLLVAQTCGLPYRACLHAQVGLVATPVCALPDCPPGYYNSALVVRADDPRDRLAAFAGARLAYNEGLSQSGWAAPMAHTERAGLRFGSVLRTGAHAASARAVAQGRADIAALDALTWRLLGRLDPQQTARLRVLERTAPTPALPYITAGTRDPGPLHDALAQGLAALDDSDREALGIEGVTILPPDAYLALPLPAPPPARDTVIPG